MLRALPGHANIPAMYHFLILLTLTLPQSSRPVEFRHQSKEVWPVEKCMELGLAAANRVLDKARAQRGKPNVKAEVSCVRDEVHPA